MDQRVMQALVVDTPNRVEMRTVPVAPVFGGDVLIRTAYVGICATDLEIVNGHIPRIRYPHIPGHEWSGIVEQAGSGADESLVGCRVVGHNLLTCGRCPACHRGKWNECAAMQEIGFERDGGFGQFFVTRASQVRVLPESVTLREGCLIEPVAVCVYAVERVGIEVGDTAVVFGDGPIGLISLQVARLLGASSVLVVGGGDAQLSLARELGATATISYRGDVDIPAAIAQYQPRTDVAIEASGNPSALEGALTVLGPGGRLGIIGDYRGATVRIDPTSLMHRNLTVVGSNASPGTWDKAIALVAARRVRLAPLITATYALDEWDTALEVARTHRDGAVKVVLRVHEEE